MRASLPRLSTKNPNLIDAVYVFVFALPAPSYERLRRTLVSTFEFIL
jgi:hypothetical protein